MEPNSLLAKQIRSTRIFLFIVAAITLISAIILIPFLHSLTGVVNLAITIAVAIVYLVLALWSKKKPYTAICYGFAVLAIIVVADIFLNPFGPLNRWQSKLLTLFFLFLGLADSRDAQRKMAAEG